MRRAVAHPTPDVTVSCSAETGPGGLRVRSSRGPAGSARDASEIAGPTLDLADRIGSSGCRPVERAKRRLRSISAHARPPCRTDGRRMRLVSISSGY
jgi:hypothetical protein